MFAKLFIVLPVLFAFPGVTMQWAADHHTDMLVQFEGVDPRWQECVERGLQARYRMEVKLCRVRKFWLDGCAESRVSTRAIEKDPVSGMYRVESDVLNDTDEPEATSYETYADALAGMLVPVQVSLRQLEKGDPRLAASDSKYLRAQVFSACRGEVSPTLRRLSQFLSFGLLDLQDQGSDWIDFEVK